ncbi:ATP-binding protein [Streptomyces murinus]
MRTRRGRRAWPYEDDAGRPVVTQVFDRAPEAVAEVRQFAADAVARWQQDAVADKVVLAASELATNAVLHARREAIRVTLRLLSGRVRVEVYDFSRTMPVLTAVGADEVHGRGLALVEAVSRSWGTDLLPWGKQVWAEVEAPSEALGPAQPDETPRWDSPTTQVVYGAIVLVVLGALACGVGVSR